MRVRYLALLLCLYCCTVRARACDCVPFKVCGAMKPGGTLFLGEVVSQRSLWVLPVPERSTSVDRTRSFTSRVFRMRVVEAFSGGSKVGEEVDVSTGDEGMDCRFDFAVGRKYLVDAYEARSEAESAALGGISLSTSLCSRTREESDAGIALRELRTELSHGRQPDLHGSVRSLDGRYGFPGHVLSSLQVTLTKQGDSAVYRAETDADGIYTVATLPPGDYRAAVALPAHQTLIIYADSKPLQITIPANDGTGLACHLDVLAGPTGGIRVRVVDARGKLRPGGMEARRPGEPPEDHPFGHEFSNDGRFVLKYLPDGVYQLRFDNYRKHLSGVSAATVQNGEVIDGGVIVAKPSPRAD